MVSLVSPPFSDILSKVLPGQSSRTMGLHPLQSSIRLYLPLETGRALFCFSGAYMYIFRRTSHLIVCRFNRNVDSEDSVSCIYTESLSDHWITHVSWSPWVTRDIGYCKLSYCFVNGIFITAQANPYWLSPQPTATLDWSRSLKLYSPMRTLVWCRSTRRVLYSMSKNPYGKLINEA